MTSGATFSSGREQSLWLATHEQPAFSPLTINTSADVCVIGAGLAGLSTAYRLAREGLSVIVLEDGFVGSGETGRTTAHLSNVIDDRYTEIERIHGQDGARLAAASHSAAIDEIERTIQNAKIECSFCRLDGYLILSPEHTVDLLREEQTAAQKAGLNTVELLDRCPLLTDVAQPCLRFPHQAQFHVLQYLSGLAHAFIKRGGQLYTQTHATDIRGGRQAYVRTASGLKIEAKSIVVATNTPINDRVTMHTKQAPYRTYVVGSRIPTESVPLALYWDTGDPYHYVRLQSFSDTEDVLIIGGEDHKTGQPDDGDRYARLMEWAQKWFPSVKTMDFKWSGQVMESIDGLAFIGRNPGDEDNVYIVTGDSGMGMTHGTIASLLLTDLICGRENPWTDLYDPSRIRLKAAAEFTRENVNTAGQYTRWIKPGEVESIEEIAPGQGAIMSKGASKLAVYRDSSGTAHIRSAVCPHLRCIVGWNSDEQTWDCPCHGSRFDRYGKVMNGPANEDLAKASIEKASRTAFP
jgi:glycine/D-amino acid oxidase-like deaminating enzyme/nitrite reductase/ring-hydroxylating ferredoxin subunit